VTCTDLARLVADMRRAQREYFRTRSSAALEASKALERRVDRAVEDCLRQPSLFTDPEEARS
jgi:hypothetical protein